MRTYSILGSLLLAAACGGGDAGITATGTVEIRETEAAISVPGRLTRSWVEEGDSVRAGDTLATLTSTTLPSDLSEQEADAARAAAELIDLRRGARPEEIARAASELRTAETELSHAQLEMRRAQALARDGSISAQELDAREAAAERATSRRDAATESLRLLRAGARADQIRAAEARLGAARAKLDGTRREITELTLIAPVDGIVLERFIEAGELVAANEPILLIGEASKPWVRVYVNQRDLPQLRVGGRAEAELDGVPDERFAGRITSINTQAEFTPRVALTEEEREDMLFGVKVDLSEQSGRVKPGLPVTVTLLTAAGGDTRVASARTP